MTQQIPTHSQIPQPTPVGRSDSPVAQASTSPALPAGIEKAKTSWREWNTSRTLSSSKRQALKIESLQALAQELASSDQAVSQRVGDVTRTFFHQKLDQGENGVRNLLNLYCNLVDEISDDLSPLADDQLLSNTWRSS